MFSCGLAQAYPKLISCLATVQPPPSHFPALRYRELLPRNSAAIRGLSPHRNTMDCFPRTTSDVAMTACERDETAISRYQA